MIMYPRYCKSFFQSRNLPYLFQLWHSSSNLCKQVRMEEENLVVTVNQGQLSGKTAFDHDGNKFYCFQGIPYAKPPLGELRFKAPQPPEPWSGIRQAITEGNECYAFQTRLQRIAGSEDCLFLNVYTPQLPSPTASNLKPVMVWLHGGAFMSGSGSIESYGPDFLITQDVVIVLINYRYGLLGFLSFENSTLGVPGNAGLKDQVFALKWVKENIKSFSGDPDNITMFGESAGGASVHYLMMSPMATGLFNKAIMQSGSVFCRWARGEYSAPFISTALESEPQSERELLEILREMPVERLYEIQQKVCAATADTGIEIQHPFVPVIERPSDEPGFLLEDPLSLIQSGAFNKIPMIIGYNSREGMMFASSENNSDVLEANFEKLVPYFLHPTRGLNLRKEIPQLIKEFYHGDEGSSNSNIDQTYMLWTDILVLTAVNEAVKLHAIEASAPVYYYRMSVESKLNKYKTLLGFKATGVCHADDLGYLFKTARTPKIQPNSVEDCGMRRFVKLWTNFAKYGDPNPVEKDPLINIKWKPVNKNELHYLDIGENLTIGINPDASRVAFWDKVTKLVKQ